MSSPNSYGKETEERHARRVSSMVFNSLNRRLGPLLAGHRKLVLVVTLAFVAGSYGASLQRLEAVGYDLALRLLPSQAPVSPVAVAAIDEEAVTRIGPWPWPRDRIARTVDRLRQLGASAVGVVLPLSSAETPVALEPLVEKAQENKKLAGAARRWGQRLDTDGALARSLDKLRRSVIVAETVPGGVRGALPEPLSAGVLAKERSPTWSVERLLWPLLKGPSQPPAQLVAPLELFLEASSGVGAAARPYSGYPLQLSVPLAVEVPGGVLPHVVAGLAGLVEGSRASLDPASGRLRVAGLSASREQGYGFFPLPASREGSPVPIYSVGALWDQEVSQGALAERVVLLGLTSGALVPMLEVAGGARLPPVTWYAHGLAGLLDGRHISPVQPFYGLQRAFILGLAALLWLLPARLRGRGGLLLALLTGLALLNVELGLLLANHLWVPLTLPVVFLLATQSLLALRQGLLDWAQRGLHEAAAARRELAARLQSDGELEAARSQLERCPDGPEMLEPLYRLGQELERRRQPKQALAQYGRAAGIDVGYKDLKARMAKLAELSSGGRAPQVPHPAPDTTVVLPDASLERPQIAHYRLLEELGRGAMGVVYLAEDLKIGRRVAVKALTLSDEFHGDALREAQERFTREASAAGRLSHPQIVTIYETGRDQDVAYIAMDYVAGESLESFTDPDDLLPVAEVLEIGAAVADALAYAHRNQVVHRDIKPSNIIYDREQGSVKVTDFGIARLSDESRTRTGVLLGTPSYMSPEQAAGKSVDGRTDLYSLGVTLYQLLTGRLPFVGDSLANLMYRIATEEPQGVRRLRPELQVGLSRLIARTLNKEPERRFSRGEEMAEALRRCLDQEPAPRRRASGR